jgi:hypothetical protein
MDLKADTVNKAIRDGRLHRIDLDIEKICGFSWGNNQSGSRV